MKPRRLLGRALRTTATAGRLPVISGAVRAISAAMAGLTPLRDARLGSIAPYDPRTGRAAAAGPDAAEADS